MQTLVTILSGIALLVWGTHIVRSGVLRVLGGSLRPANLRLGLNVFLNGDLKSAQRLLATKVELRKLQQQYADTHLGRLAGQTVQSIETSSLHLDIINDFKRINSHICSVAYPILEQAGALQPTRLREDFANGEVKQKHA